jgi:hypothetical protein
MVTAFAGMFICWSTIYLGKIALVGADQETDKGQNIGLLLAGITPDLVQPFRSQYGFQRWKVKCMRCQLSSRQLHCGLF